MPGLSQPLMPGPLPAAGPPRHACLSGLGPALTSAIHTGPEPGDSIPRMPEILQGPDRFSSLPAHLPGPECPRGVSPLWVGLLGAGGLFTQPLFSPDLDSRFL